jgi:hypothetical protein
VRICALVLALCASAPAAEPVRRHVVALMPGTVADEHTEDIVHQLLEMPLNHLGIVVRRHYVGNGPPPEAWLKDARAVLTWFHGGIEPIDWLWPWMERAVTRHKLRVIHLGDFGPLQSPELGPWLKRFGLDYDTRFVAGPIGIDVRFHDEDACAYEDNPRRRAIHRGPRSTGADNDVWVATRPVATPDDVRAPVVTGPWGGLALDPWVANGGTEQNDRRWYLDPFRFLRDALGLARVPAPHPSVLNGRRMWFMQVDGDGFESHSTVRPGAFSAEILLDEVLLQYRLPYTVSIIVRGLTSDYEVKEPTPAMKLAQRILNLRNVEAASHGVLHTLEWQRPLRQDSSPREIIWYGSLRHYAYSPEAEVRESIRFINERLLDRGKRCELMLWTGNANPLEGPLDETVDAKCWNLNGGVFRWDRWTDSVGYVSPWSRRVGKRLQVYAGAANENDFDGYFTTMPTAFRHIDTTIERTGSQRILKPANIYIHFYSAASPARLGPVHDLIRRWALREPTAPVFASTYAKSVHSAVETARYFTTARGWRFEGFGDCRSVRIDGDARPIDWRASRNLIGARRIGDSLYLHLAAPDAEVAFGELPQRYPHVREANCLLEDAILDGAQVKVVATAHNRRVITFAGFVPGSPVRVRIDEQDSTVHADRHGAVTVTLPTPGTTRVTVARR